MLRRRVWGRKLLTRLGDWRATRGLWYQIWSMYANVNGTMPRQDGPKHTAEATIPLSRPKLESAVDGSFFRRHILEDLIPFWENTGLDTHHGGFVRCRDRTGQKFDREVKASARHARMIYGFSVAYGLSKNTAYLNAAEQGVSFLIRNFWDDRYSGWYSRVRSDGERWTVNRVARVKHVRVVEVPFTPVKIRVNPCGHCCVVARVDTRLAGLQAQIVIVVTRNVVDAISVGESWVGINVAETSGASPATLNITVGYSRNTISITVNLG